MIIEVQSVPTPTKKEVMRYLCRFFPEKHFKKLTLKKSTALSARTLYHEMNILSQDLSHVIYVIKSSKNKGASWDAIWNRLDKACSRRIVLNPD